MVIQCDNADFALKSALYGQRIGALLTAGEWATANSAYGVSMGAYTLADFSENVTAFADLVNAGLEGEGPSAEGLERLLAVRHSSVFCCRLSQ